MTRTGVAGGTRLDDRYGRAPRRLRRRRLAAVGAVAALLLAAVVWAVWTGIGGAAGSLSLQTTGYTVHGDRSATVGWLVSGDPDHRLVCAIVAQSDSAEVVGLKEVVLPVTGQVDRGGTTTVRTTRRADSGLIRSCRRA
jgi:hypothetical protein